MKIAFIRHGATIGNLEGRYIGTTDEQLSPDGAAALRVRAYPPACAVYASPMLRCTATAALIYPDAPLAVVPELRECDFGAFENKCFAELNGRADYQVWLDSGGTLPFPGGESREAFILRCVGAFDQIVSLAKHKEIAVVAHGGTIMAILSARALPGRDYYDYQVRNGQGFMTEWVSGTLRVLSLIGEV